MNKQEFLDHVNKAIVPESGLRSLTRDDLKRLEEDDFIKPPYYREHVHPAIGFLKLERDILDRQEARKCADQTFLRFPSFQF